MTRNNVTSLGCDEKLFKRVVKTAFNQRRKTLRNSLRPLVGDAISQLTDEIYNRRPEQLSVAEFISLTQQIDNLLQEKQQ